MRVALQTTDASVTRSLTIETGAGKVINFGSAAANVFVADPKVAEVKPASDTALFVFGVGTGLIGLGGGFFAHGTLTAAMRMARGGQAGLAIGAWGAVQASAAGLAVAMGGIVRDGVGSLAGHGALGPALNDAATGYGVVYTIEISLLFATLVAIGPLVRTTTFAAASRIHPLTPLQSR